MSGKGPVGFFVFGIHHKRCPVEIRERLHFDPETLRAALVRSRGHQELSELVILSTCNRVELFGYTELESCPVEALVRLIEEVHGGTRDVMERYADIRLGRDAVEYIFRVAAGLESLVIGEAEILNQVREAFRAASETGSTPALMHRLMEKALKTGKEVRHRTRISEGAVSIPSVAVELAEKIFGKLAGEKVMVLGTGEMSLQTLRNLKAAGAEILYVASRDAAHGAGVAAEFGASWIPYEKLEDCLKSVDILITATSAFAPLLEPAGVRAVMDRRRHRPLFVIDIAVPRNVDPGVNDIDDVYLYNIDDLKSVTDSNLTLRRKQMLEAQGLTQEAVDSFSSWLEQLEARPTLEHFEAFVDEILDRELVQALDGLKVSPADRERIRQRIRSRLLHAPIEKIKEASRNGGVKRYLEALRSLFNLDRFVPSEPRRADRKQDENLSV